MSNQKLSKDMKALDAIINELSLDYDSLHSTQPQQKITSTLEMLIQVMMCDNMRA
jgi:hypothetical protein